MNLLLFDIGNLRINDNYLLREINKNNNNNIGFECILRK